MEKCSGFVKQSITTCFVGEPGAISWPEKITKHSFLNKNVQKSITRSLHLVLGRVLCLSRVGYF